MDFQDDSCTNVNELTIRDAEDLAKWRIKKVDRVLLKDKIPWLSLKRTSRSRISPRLVIPMCDTKTWPPCALYGVQWANTSPQNALGVAFVANNH